LPFDKGSTKVKGRTKGRIAAAHHSAKRQGHQSHQASDLAEHRSSKTFRSQNRFQINLTPKGVAKT
jgi:hypothetical protein